MKAAVFHAVKQPLTIEDIDIDQPGPQEILVRTAASGVCHSDLHYVEGLYPLDPPVNAQPAVLGHEAAGIVEAVGSQVTEFKPGDRVIACLSVYCGNCERCLTGHPNLCQDRPTRKPDEKPRLSWKGKRLTQLANMGSYADKMLLHQNGAVKITQNIGLDHAALISCGVTTGVGAVLNTAKIEAGCTVAVFGLGGVGLAAVQGAKIGGARTIIAVDINERKLKTALDLGATHVVDSSSHDPVESIIKLTGGGVDYSFEAVGAKTTAEQAYGCLREGGTATVIGMIPVGTKVEIEGRTLLRERKLQGSSMGSNRFKFDMPKYVDFYLQGRLLLDEMITRRMRLKDINEAFRAMKAGEVARTVLMFD